MQEVRRRQEKGSEGASPSATGLGGLRKPAPVEMRRCRVPEPRKAKERGGRNRGEGVDRGAGIPLYESDVVDLNLYLSFRFPVNFQVAPWMTSFLLLVCDPNRFENAS